MTGPTARAIAAAALAALLFTAMDNAVKIVAERHSVIQAGFFNALFATPPILTALAVQGFGSLRSARPLLHVLRGGFAVGGLLLTFFAYSRLPVADAYALLFTMPLIITALSAPLLGERVSGRRWLAVLLGFAGVLVMLRPGSGIADLAAFAALGGATLSGIGMLLLRLVQRTDGAAACIIYSNTAVLVGMATPLPWFFTTPTAGDLGISLLGGLCGGLAFLLLAAAYRQAPAAVVAPFQYTQMPYALLSGWLLYGLAPQPIVLAGAAIVIASGLYIMRAETGSRAALAVPASGAAGDRP